MSIYRCSECDETFDGDYDPCYEYDSKEVCEECYNTLKDTYSCHDDEPETKPTRPDWDMKDKDYL